MDIKHHVVSTLAKSTVTLFSVYADPPEELLLAADVETAENIYSQDSGYSMSQESNSAESQSEPFIDVNIDAWLKSLAEPFAIPTDQ